MARFTKTELLDYIQNQTLTNVQSALSSGLPSGQELTMSAMRDGIVSGFTQALAGVAEGFRHLTSVSNAEGILYQTGGDEPSGQFSITLIQAGQPGGIVIDGVETGYQLIPIVTGAPNGGVVINADDFDGASEIRQATANPDTLRIDHDGQITISASCLAEPSNQNNKQLDLDICVFDENGDASSLLGFRASTNNGSDGRANTSIIPCVTLQDTGTIPAGHSIGLVIRRSAAETTNVTVTMLRSFILASYTGLAKN